MSGDEFYGMTYDDLSDEEQTRMRLDVHATAARIVHADYDAVVDPYLAKIQNDPKITGQIIDSAFPAETAYKLAGNYQESLNEIFEDSEY